MQIWNPNKIWHGETVYILGGGPSLEDMDLSIIHGKRVVGVNNSFLLGDWVDVCWFGDLDWLQWHEERLAEFQGIVATCNEHPEVRRYPFVKTLRRGKTLGIDEREGWVSWNWCSGTSAINLAYHMGASQVVLLGFDMRLVDGKKNWHDDHQEDSNPDPYERFLRAYPFVARDAERLGFKIINATPDSAINVFPMASLEDIVETEWLTDAE